MAKQRRPLAQRAADRMRELVSPAGLRRLGLDVLRWLYDARWMFAIFAAALIVRWHWNEEIHPPGEYIYSDMNGYVSRSRRLLLKGLEPHEYSSFFPFGTHWLMAGIQKIYGPENWVAVGRVWAILGALAVAAAYAFARRASSFPNWVAPVLGFVGIFYYPHFSLGGYFLSETPFCAMFMISLAFLMRMADRGSYVDSLLMGLFAGLAMVCRPQVMLSAAIIGLFWIVWRKALPKIKLAHLATAFVPVLVLIVLSSALLRHNTGRNGLISENGTFNLVFGRCHNSKIQSMPDGAGHGRVHFRPPPFLQLNNAERKKKREKKKVEVALNPAIEDEISYRGYIGDRDKHMDLIKECIKRTGWKGQLEYTWVNVQLLWRWNIPWPDSGRKQWREVTRWWTKQHRNFIAIPALLGLGFMLTRRTVKAGLIATNLLALLILAAIFFGAVRHRSTYDFVILFLAFEVFTFGLWGIGRAIRQFVPIPGLPDLRPSKAGTSAQASAPAAEPEAESEGGGEPAEADGDAEPRDSDPA